MPSQNYKNVGMFYNSLNVYQKKYFRELAHYPEDIHAFVHALDEAHKKQVDKVILIVEDVWKLSTGDLRTKNRKPDIVRARSQYYKSLSLFTAISYETITRYINRDHSTMSHALNKGWFTYKMEADFRDKWEIVRDRVLKEVFNQEKIQEP